MGIPEKPPRLFTPEEAALFAEMAKDPQVKEDFAKAKILSRESWKQPGYGEAWMKWLIQAQADAGHPRKPFRPITGDHWVL